VANQIDEFAFYEEKKAEERKIYSDEEEQKISSNYEQRISSNDEQILSND
jgi:hypothetical protein